LNANENALRASEVKAILSNGEYAMSIQNYSTDTKLGLCYLGNKSIKNLHVQSYLTVLLLLLFSLAASTFSVADETTELQPGVIVKEAVVQPAKKGETARLRFKVVNLLRQDILLRGISAEIADTTELRMNVTDEGYEAIEDIPIYSEETLNLVSSHIRVELIALKGDLKRDDEMKFELDFGDFKVPAIADVH